MITSNSVSLIETIEPPLKIQISFIPYQAQKDGNPWGSFGMHPEFGPTFPKSRVMDHGPLHLTPLEPTKVEWC